MRSGVMANVLLMVFVIGASGTLSVQIRATSPRTWYVPTDFPTIQGAINGANDGDTVMVRAGTYYEFVVVNKTLSLVGEDRRTIIDGNGTTPTVVAITRSNVSISGFTLQRGGTGIRIAGTSGNIILRNNITNNIFYGIWLNHSSSRNTVSQNNIVSNGIFTFSAGIYVDTSQNNIITRNYIAQTTSGIDFEQASNNIIFENTIANNAEGIRAWDSHNNDFRNNNITGNYAGSLSFVACWNNAIIGNDLTGNGEIYFSGSSNNSIYHNNFIHTGHVVGGGSVDTWDNGYPSGGNYWSDYMGVDFYGGPYQNESGSDGIGDTAYVINAQNLDRYPLMSPWITQITSDVNHDGKVDILDIVTIASIYGCKEDQPNWNPYADIAQPYGVIDILDLVTCTAHYGQTYP